MSRARSFPLRPNRMQRSAPSLAGRAVLAVLLLVGFYVFALALVAVLLAWPFLIPHFHPAHFVAASYIGAGIILWAIFPRIDRFEDPGPRITRASQPRLFASLDLIAKECGQPVPEEVFLLDDVNAFVAERGGWMGFGSRRVMGIGVPLLHGLTVDEFRAVVAHEFGHFHGGDTRLGPWIHKTRAAIGRTLGHLAAQDKQTLHRVFTWYASMFLRVTQAISRAQEFAADRLAAESMGPRALGSSLQKIRRLAFGYEFYQASEFTPVVQAGRRPALIEGFQRFLAHPKIGEALGRFDETAHGEVVDPFDSHPPLEQRLAAIAEIRVDDRTMSDGLAIRLLDDLAGVELALLGTRLSPRTDPRKLAPIRWEDVFQDILLESWRSARQAQAKALAGLRVRDVAELARNPRGVYDRIAHVAGAPLEQRQGLGRHILGVGFAMALVDAGWKGSSEPGGPITFRRGEEELRPFEEIERMSSREEEHAARWKATCARLGIGDRMLGLDPNAD